MKWILLVLFLGVPVFGQELVVPTAAVVPVVAKSYVTMVFVDDFEDGELKTPNWWTFGNLALGFDYNTPVHGVALGTKSVAVRGLTGGFGTYRPMDLASFGGVRLVLWGSGEHSGHLQIQLFDDDNGNYVVELYQNSPKIASRDDMWIHTLKVDWDGWREVILPFSFFHDGNPGIGDGIWNPYKAKGSGGFLQIQLILFPSQVNKPVNVKLDSLSFVGGFVMPEDTVGSEESLEMPVFENLDSEMLTPAERDSQNGYY